MAAPRSKKKVISKDDLRRLMREKQNSIKASTKKIDSPYAKYNSLGQVVCTVCNSQLKSELLWSAHVQGRTHKENVAALKAENERKAVARPATPPGLRKRKHAPNGEQAKEKAARLQKVLNEDTSTKGLPSDFFDDEAKGKAASLKLGNYSSSEDDEQDDSTQTSVTPAPTASTGLPSDFFDAGIVSGTSKMSEEEELKPQSMAEKLPEGFFDDPKQDAKVREVEYRDKMEDEWDLFQKAMKEETTKSEAIQAEDDEANITERNIDEIDDQLHRWSKVNNLAKKKEEIMSSEADKNKHNESDDSDVDEQEFDEFLDWRTKKAWK